MIRHAALAFALGMIGVLPTNLLAGNPGDISAATPNWPQWRGPNRDGKVTGPKWPDRLEESSLQQLWRVPLGPSYSGPIVTDQLVFTTETKNKESEVVLAYDRKTGKERWRAEWEGAKRYDISNRTSQDPVGAGEA